MSNFINCNNGYQMKFDNGMTVSVQWNVGTFSDNKMFYDRSDQRLNSETAEVAVMLPDGKSFVDAAVFIHGRNVGNVVAGWCTTNEVAEVISRVSALNKRQIELFELRNALSGLEDVAV